MRRNAQTNSLQGKDHWRRDMNRLPRVETQMRRKTLLPRPQLPVQLVPFRASCLLCPPRCSRIDFPNDVFLNSTEINAHTRTSLQCTHDDNGQPAKRLKRRYTVRCCCDGRLCSWKRVWLPFLEFFV